MSRAATFILAALAALPTAASSKLGVVTTTTDLAALAREVGGDRVEVSSIASGTQDPHYLDAKPSFIMRARSADLFLAVGMDLEVGWERAILDGARNARIRPGQPGYLDCSSVVAKLEVPAGTIDRSMGDVHAEGNPHYWNDPWNARLVAAAIARRLGELSPSDAPAFEDNLAAFRRRLDRAMFGGDLVEAASGDELWRHELAGDLAAWCAGRGLPRVGGWTATMAPHRGRKVFTYHRSWSYFAHRFGLVLAGEIEPKPGIPPTPGHLLELIRRGNAENVGAILVETFYSDQAPSLVASKTEAVVVRLPLSVGGDPKAATYVSHVALLVDSVAAALSRSTGE